MSEHTVCVTDAHEAKVTTAVSAAAVGLLVEEMTELPAALEKPRAYRGAFLTPEQARKVATELNEFADQAESEAERVQALRKARAPLRFEVEYRPRSTRRSSSNYLIKRC